MFTEAEKGAELELEKRIVGLDFDSKKFIELEDIQIQGKLPMLRRILARNVDNEQLLKYVKRFRKQQVSLSL